MTSMDPEVTYTLGQRDRKFVAIGSDGSEHPAEVTDEYYGTGPFFIIQDEKGEVEVIQFPSALD